MVGWPPALEESSLDHQKGDAGLPLLGDRFPINPPSLPNELESILGGLSSPPGTWTIALKSTISHGMQPANVQGLINDRYLLGTAMHNIYPALVVDPPAPRDHPTMIQLKTCALLLRQQMKLSPSGLTNAAAEEERLEKAEEQLDNNYHYYNT